MNRRGLTLTEVLVAIFVTGLGLISVMTLFPLGALSMAEAVKDDRAGQCAPNASAYLRTWWRTQVENGLSDTWGPNYPVYVDPIGVGATAGGPLGGATIQRVPAPWATSNALIYQQFMLLDDMTFNQNGLARNAYTATPIERQGYYSWAYMVRRLALANGTYDPRVLEYEIVVYRGRSMNLSGGGLSDETPGPASLVAGANSVVVPNSVSVKRGGWICDGTNGYFYRVRSVTPQAGGNLVVVENPFRASSSLVVGMKNVVEVFERSTLE